MTSTADRGWEGAATDFSPRLSFRPCACILFSKHPEPEAESSEPITTGPSEGEVTGGGKLLGFSPSADPLPEWVDPEALLGSPAASCPIEASPTSRREGWGGQGMSTAVGPVEDMERSSPLGTSQRSPAMSPRGQPHIDSSGAWGTGDASLETCDWEAESPSLECTGDRGEELKERHPKSETRAWVNGDRRRRQRRRCRQP
jgi:hypothetical protein